MATTTDRAAQIRQALKAYGYTSRQVSVRADYYSMGSSTRVQIKDAAVPMSLVKMIAEPHEDIDRDQFGDILSGGNRFVDVSYSQEALTVLASKWVKPVENAIAKVHDNYLINVEGLAHCMVGRDHNGYGLTLWGQDGRIGSYDSAVGIAQRIGAMLVQA